MWRPGVAHTLGLLADAGADNVRLLSVDAVWCLEHLFGPGEVEELWTFFPDPWPKTRHHKRRLVNAGVRRARRLASSPRWRVAAGDRLADYAEQMQRVLDAEPTLQGGPCRALGGTAVTKFERKGRPPSASIVDLAYRRRSSGPGSTRPDS